ncbi:MAG: glycosyltransferase [Chitinophagaceae bacterium]
MKVLIVQAGVPYTRSEDTQNNNNFSHEMTLTKGILKLNSSKYINSTQTRDAIAAQEGIDVHYYYYTHRKSIFNLIKGTLAIRKIVKENKVAIVNLYWGGLSSLLASLFCPAVFVVTLLGSDLHGSYNRNGSKTLFGKVLSFFSQLTCYYADGVIVMSEKMKNKVWKKNRHKVEVIPEGVDLTKFFLIEKQSAREHLHWPLTDPIVLFFNNTSFVKNFPLAEAVFALVKVKIPTAKLMVVNNIPHRQTVWYYNAADALLLTSLHEGSNNSIKESLACGLPVVTTDSGDAVDRLKNVTPSFVSPDWSKERLAEKLVEILNGDNGKSNGPDVVTEVELTVCAAATIAYYRRLANDDTFSSESGSKSRPIMKGEKLYRKSELC